MDGWTRDERLDEIDRQFREAWELHKVLSSMSRTKEEAKIKDKVKECGTDWMEIRSKKGDKLVGLIYLVEDEEGNHCEFLSLKGRPFTLAAK